MILVLLDFHPPELIRTPVHSPYLYTLNMGLNQSILRLVMMRVKLCSLMSPTSVIRSLIETKIFGIFITYENNNLRKST